MNDSTEFVVPAGSALGVPLTNTNSITTSSSTEFKANGADTKKVKEIRLTKLMLTITNPPSEDFSFLNSIHISILADGLPETEIAYLDNISASVGNTLDLVTTNAILDDYISKDSYSLKIKTVTDEVLTQNVTIHADMSFRVRAKLL